MRFTEPEKLLLREAANRLEEQQADIAKLHGSDPLYDYGTHNLIRDLRRLEQS